MRKILTAFLAVMMVFNCVAPAGSAENYSFDDASSKPIGIEPWQTAFLDVLKEKREERTAISTDQNGIDSYALYDMDRDGIPELFLRFGTDTAGSKCLLYRYTGNSASFVDEFYFGDSELYSIPDAAGVLNVYQRMLYARGELLSLTDNALNSTLYFEERIEPGDWFQPVSSFYQGAVVVTEFRYDQDYPVLSYNIWSQPGRPAEETHYPDNNPDFFTDLFINNSDVIKVRLPEAWFSLPGNDTETIGVRDLLSSLSYYVFNSMFGGMTNNDSRSKDSEIFESYIVDLDHDGQLELLISHQREESDYSSWPFTMILSEQNGIVYAYVDELRGFTDVNRSGVIYKYTNDHGFISEYAYRVFFNAENCMKIYCNLEEYLGSHDESKEIVGYNMVHYGTQMAVSPHYRIFRDYSINEAYGEYGARESYGEKHFTRYVDASSLSSAKTYEPGSLITGDYAGYQQGTDTAYSFGDDKYVWFIESPVYG